MTDSELIVIFALAMAAVCLVALGVDWIGKPIHRRFIPKIYRYPEELAPPPDPTRTEWSDDTFRVPDNPPDDEPVGFVDGSTEWSEAVLVLPESGQEEATPNQDMFAEIPDDLLDPEPEPEPVPVEAKANEIAAESEAEPSQEPDLPTDPPGFPSRSVGWRPGQYVYNLTRDGSEPSQKMVSRRFWRNVAGTEHLTAFGAVNKQRVAAGKAPVRRNPRTGDTEAMRLPKVNYLQANGRPPLPSWNDESVDPYGRS